ncbi:hypothetical protein O6P43_001684 [Quillaja saponaria]|uniref:Uncharacterized protein n=1 Tax=Quillaja saponaria TaxID=32244 RepID=A0AAD7QJJ6_QUISA|nr:hypothetical protein O6P43_001684 [Quillaja saponaria]
MLNYGPSNRVDPFLLLLLAIGDEVHRGIAGGEFEGTGFVHNVLGALNSEANTHWDDASWCGRAGDIMGILEPKELTLFKDEPVSMLGLNEIALFGEPP